MQPSPQSKAVAGYVKGRCSEEGLTDRLALMGQSTAAGVAAAVLCGCQLALALLVGVGISWHLTIRFRFRGQRIDSKTIIDASRSTFFMYISTD